MLVAPVHSSRSDCRRIRSPFCRLVETVQLLTSPFLSKVKKNHKENSPSPAGPFIMRPKRWGSEENPFVLGLYPAIGGDREDALLSSKGCSSHLVCDTLRPSPKNRGKKLHKDRPPERSKADRQTSESWSLVVMLVPLQSSCGWCTSW